jgi:NNP family nitrate/nitrite transporter-like MFS transporter
MSTSSTTGGHSPTLLASFLHFDISFMLWVLLGALGIYIAESAGMGAAQKGLMVAIPILTGSALRVPLGILSDRIGGRRVGIGILVFLLLPLTLGWRGGDDATSLFVLGALLGVAGASFAVVLPLASRWYPAERQGLVMGIAAAGNSGTVIANVFAPRLANSVGWHNVFGLAMLPLMMVLVAFWLLAKDAPASTAKRPASHYLTIAKQADIWWFCMFYCVTFGGYVGLSSFLPLFLRDHYGVTPVMAGSLTALAALVGSGVRPIGGYLADRLGGVRLLLFLLLSIGLTYAAAARLPTLVVMESLLIFGMVCLGMGNGAVFQLVPQRFQSEIGVATGIVGAVGGMGGFLLPMLLGSLKQLTGSFGPGFLVLACLAIASAFRLQRLLAVQTDWRTGWRSQVQGGSTSAVPLDILCERP